MVFIEIPNQFKVASASILIINTIGSLLITA